MSKKRGPPSAPPADDQVRIIATEMASGEWKSGKSHAAKAEDWGLSLNSIYDRASEAGRVLRLAMGDDREALRAQAIATLEAITNEARAAGEFSAAVRAVETWAKMRGLLEPDERAGAFQFATPADALRFAEGVVLRLREQLAMPVAALPAKKRADE